MDGNLDLVSKPGDVLIGSPGDVYTLCVIHHNIVDKSSTLTTERTIKTS